jgi:hypothetical protein
MKIIKGSSRTAIVFGCIVIKFPIIRLRLGLQELWQEFKEGALINHFRKYDYEQFGTIPHFFFRGIFNNWLEFVFYQKNKSLLLLAPTYFSLLGLLNVQKYCEPLCVEDMDFWHQIGELAGNVIWKDVHVFSNVKNFGMVNGRLKIVDYGSRGSREALKECADKIYSEFSFSYSRKKSLYD